jgi:hypothetical protein
MCQTNRGLVFLCRRFCGEDCCVCAIKAHLHQSSHSLLCSLELIACRQRAQLWLTRAAQCQPRGIAICRQALRTQANRVIIGEKCSSPSLPNRCPSPRHLGQNGLSRSACAYRYCADSRWLSQAPLPRYRGLSAYLSHTEEKREREKKINLRGEVVDPLP